MTEREREKKRKRQKEKAKDKERKLQNPHYFHWNEAASEGYKFNAIWHSKNFARLCSLTTMFRLRFAPLKEEKALGGLEISRAAASAH